jgi:phosphoadenosine phosphosulfate reductase
MSSAAPIIQESASAAPANRTDSENISLAAALSAYQAAALNALLAGVSPEHIIAAAQEAVPAGKLAIVSSFGAESAVLLAAAAAVDKELPVLLIDTGYLFSETLTYRDQLEQQLALADVRAVKPDEAILAVEDADGDLYAREPDACCNLRKVRPLSRALAGFAAWANGRKRFQGGGRAVIPLVEADGPRLKFNPLAALSAEEIAIRFRRLGLPFHPLAKYGFRSIGCMPCTTRTADGEDPRAGRWRGRGKVECGIHLPEALKA